MDVYTSVAMAHEPQDNHRLTIFNTSLATVRFEHHNYPGTMSTLRTSPSIEGLLLDLHNGTSCAVSDGSFYPNEKVGAAAWIIITPDGTDGSLRRSVSLGQNVLVSRGIFVEALKVGSSRCTTGV